MTPDKTARADLHCHSTASQLSKLGVQRALGLPECATPPEEVYELAKRRRMDFVTITDHDTIAGAVQIADRPDVFVSVELTARFKGEPQAVHVLCWDITPGDHEWLQAHNGDVEEVADYLAENEIASALAHPFYSVDAPLTAAHRRRLARMFPIWETRNGSREHDLNQPAAAHIETNGGVGVGGSDDHAGVDIGRTFTQTPAAASPQAFLRHVQSGRARARGDQGSAAKWVHAAVAIAARTLGDHVSTDAPPDPRRVIALVDRLMREADARGATGVTLDLGPEDGRALLRGFLEGVGLGELDAAELIAHMQAEEFAHADLYRRARRAHERRLSAAVDDVLLAVERGEGAAEAAAASFRAALPVLPYAPAAAFLARERTKIAPRGDAVPRVALVADGVGGMHGVTHTLEEIRERGVPGFEVEVVGTDPNVDRRLPAVRDVEMPFYAGLQIGVPSLPSVVEALAYCGYDLVHVCTPGPSGVAAAMVAHLVDLPLVGSYHTELAAYTALRAADPRLEGAMLAALSVFYGRCDVVLSPSESSDATLGTLGIEAGRVRRWDRGVDVERFRPELREQRLLPGEVNVLYVGRLTLEKGADLLADAFLAARERDPRLHLCLAGGGPEEERLRARLGEHATFLGWLEGDDLALAYASADAFLFASRTDTFGQVLLEAQASGLPVIAVDEGGPRAIIDDGRTGLLRAADAEALAEALCEVISSPLLRERLVAGALREVRLRSWDASLGRLADGYSRALAIRAAAGGERAELALAL